MKFIKFQCICINQQKFFKRQLSCSFFCCCYYFQLGERERKERLRSSNILLEQGIHIIHNNCPFLKLFSHVYIKHSCIHTKNINNLSSIRNWFQLITPKCNDKQLINQNSSSIFIKQCKNNNDITTIISIIITTITLIIQNNTTKKHKNSLILHLK